MKFSEVLRKLLRDGWFVQRQEGSHLIMRHPMKKGQIVMTNHGRMEMGKGLENKILKAAGLKMLI